MNEKLIIEKLFKIAENQQKILQRLAQQNDPVVDYLKKIAQTVAIQSGFTPSKVDIVVQNGASGTTSGSNEIINLPKGYIIVVGGVPKSDEIRQKFVTALNKRVASENPKLAENVSISLED